ncbi:hypothetical protein HPP92_002985 [Vanilla planifolia]|uniref:Uncharacterized protein n=1 Tax=Vanilla planifolia TaxID=51239 RepID=A0A835VN05_VANPL|nr:hypothetical protein HPP92_002985 [Vanilla planifolia]
MEIMLLLGLLVKINRILNVFFNWPIQLLKRKLNVGYQFLPFNMLPEFAYSGGTKIYVFHILKLFDGQYVTALCLNADNTNLLVSTADKQLIVFTDPTLSLKVVDQMLKLGLGSGYPKSTRTKMPKADHRMDYIYFEKVGTGKPWAQLAFELLIAASNGTLKTSATRFQILTLNSSETDAFRKLKRNGTNKTST